LGSMPFRKPIRLQVFSPVDEEMSSSCSSSMSSSIGSSAVALEGSQKKNRSDGLDSSVGSEDSIGSLRVAAASMQLRDSYSDASESEGSKKRGRGPLKRQESFEVTENKYTGTVAFASEGVRLKQDGMRDALGGQVSAISYDQLDNIKVLGRGATSKVWLKKHRPSGQQVAVKELSAMVSDDMRRMAVNELQIAHKHARQEYLVNFIDAFFADGKICIAMEYCDGGSLEGVVKASRAAGGVPPSPLGAMTLQYLRGLQYLHREMKQVHRDLKPANVMLTGKGVCKISDFGISKQLEETGSYAMTQVGTVMYMSPERFKGERYTFPSDVWSVGVITLEALTGHHPFEHIKSYMSLQAAICDQPSPLAPAGTAPEVAAFVAGCLLKDPLINKDGRPAVRQLISGSWLKPHSLGSSEAETVGYLQQLGLISATSSLELAFAPPTAALAAAAATAATVAAVTQAALPSSAPIFGVAPSPFAAPAAGLSADLAAMQQR